jgi:hypothetical protein
MNVSTHSLGTTTLRRSKTTPITMLNIKSLAFILFAAKNVLAVGSPFGFASGTTGGAGAAQAIPTSAAQLKSW